MAVLEDRRRLGGLKESTAEMYAAECGRFEDWLESKYNLSLDGIINGPSQRASALLDAYVNGYLRSAEIGYRLSVLKHLRAVFRLCGRSLLDMPKIVQSGRKLPFEELVSSK